MLKKIPNYIKYLFLNTLFLFFFIFLFRIIFYYFFTTLSTDTTPETTKAFFLGIRFDIKLAILTVIPLSIIIFIGNNSFFNKKFYRIFSLLYTTLAFITLLIFNLFDLGHYSYLNIRLNSSALRFFEDLKISFQVFIESYPVYKGSIVFLLFIFLIYKFNKWIFDKYSKSSYTQSKKRKAFHITITLLIFSFGIYNSLTHYPLRWSQAFFSKNKEINQFSLNPVLYFFDSFKFRSEGFDLNETKKYYPLIKKYLGIENNNLSFDRNIVFKEPLKTKPNIVFVMLESVGNAALSYYGNPINSSPNIDSLIRTSLNFSNHYVHKSTTAGSVFASITGLPDVDNVKSASRNPMIINQRILFDQFNDYEKLYFLGGSANWANIRAVFQSNIEGLKIFEEGSYEDENRADVWGIDDYDLFKEADKELKKISKKNKPFVAYIQTATNHMPFTVPSQKEEYRPLKHGEINESTMKKSAFRSLEQLNALRYLDFNIKRFLNRAKNSGYYNNTIFVFFGDHQGGMKNISYFKENQDKLGILRHNVPFFIHAPKYTKAKEITKNINLIDVIPTTMSLAKINHTNYTLGVNALDSTRTKNASFIYKNVKGEPSAGLIIDSIYYYKTTLSGKNELFNLNNPSIKDIKKDYPFLHKKMDSLLNAIHHSTKYLYYNNKKD